MERIVIKHQTGSKAKQTEDFLLSDFKEISFGRGSSVKVKYIGDHDHLVSRQHARITRDGDNPGQFLLIDLDSHNGTFVNKSRISSPYRLHHGDLVQFGPGGPVFVFELDPPIANSSAKQTRMSSDTGAGQATRRNPPETRDIRNTDYAIPDDLDFDYYINDAQNLFEDIQAQKPAKDTGKSKLVVAAEKAQAKGLVIVPKGRTGKGKEKAGVPNTYADETVSYWQETPLDQADWYDYQGFGAYTGQQFGVIGIDIDNLEKALNTNLFQYLSEGGMVCWHGKFDASEVRSGQKRGTIVFQYEGEALKTTGNKFFEDYGFEILYGKRMVQLAGFHNSGEAYQYKGNLSPIPKGLLSYLERLISEQDTESPELLDTESLGDAVIQQWLLEFQQKANADAEYQSVCGYLSFKQTRQGLRLTGPCVGHQEHTNKGNDQTMEVSVWNGDLRATCFHNSCRSTLKTWEKRIKEELCIQPAVVVKPENLVISEEAKEIAHVFIDEVDAFVDSQVTNLPLGSFTFDAQQPGSQTSMANDSVRPTSLANIHSDVFRPTSQAELADLTGHQSNTNLLSTWQRHQPWIIVVCMLLVTASVISFLLLLRHDVPIAPVALLPKTSTLPQPTNKTDIKAVPDTVRTEKPVRGLVVEPAPAPEQISIPNQVGTSAVTILDSVGNQSVEKVSIGTPSMPKTRKKVEIGASSTHKTRQKVKTHSSQPADDWKVIEHQ